LLPCSGGPRGSQRDILRRSARFRDETTLLWLTAVGAVVHRVSVLLLFGSGRLRSLMR
jgi:hypothetical protein